MQFRGLLSNFRGQRAVGTVMPQSICVTPLRQSVVPTASAKSLEEMAQGSYQIGANWLSS